MDTRLSQKELRRWLAKQLGAKSARTSAKMSCGNRSGGTGKSLSRRNSTWSYSRTPKEANGASPSSESRSACCGAEDSHSRERRGGRFSKHLIRSGSADRERRRDQTSPTTVIALADLASASSGVCAFREQVLCGQRLTENEAIEFMHSPALALLTPADMAKLEEPLVGHRSRITSMKFDHIADDQGVNRDAIRLTVVIDRPEGPRKRPAILRTFMLQNEYKQDPATWIRQIRGHWEVEMQVPVYGRLGWERQRFGEDRFSMICGSSPRYWQRHTCGGPLRQRCCLDRRAALVRPISSRRQAHASQERSGP